MSFFAPHGGYSSRRPLISPLSLSPLKPEQIFFGASPWADADVATQVDGQDDDAVVLLHFLQEVGDFNVCVAVVGVVDFGALAKEGVNFVE
jgi:hypothetical protein